MAGTSLQAASGHAGGKVILLGEHAVVYGSPAIALGLRQGATAHVARSTNASLTLAGERYELGPESSGDSEPLPARAFRALLAALNAPPVEALATLAIPAGAGLGASAALGVALARAVTLTSQAGGEGISAEHVARAALVWENVFHGNASGIDTAAAEQGGCLWFTRAHGAVPLGIGGALHIAVALVEPGASTRRMVELVAERRRLEPERTNAIIDAIVRLVERARQAIGLGERAELGRLMSQNHERLSELGVSTAGLDQACQWAIDAGALGAKLTGAGGGGCVIALVDEGTRLAVLEAWQRRGFECLETTAQSRR